MRNIKILHVITTLERGGAQRVLFDLIKNNLDKKIIHIVICLSIETKYTSVFRSNGIKVFHLNGLNIIQSIGILFKLVKKILEIRPDLINSWLYHSDLLASIATLLVPKSIPIIWSIHHSSKKLTGESLHTKISLKLLTLISHLVPKKIIYCSNFANEIHRKLGYKDDKSIIIDNSVDTSIFYPNNNYKHEIRNLIKIKNEEILIGLIARNDPNKGIDMFLKVIKALSKKKTNYKFMICGENMNYKKLKHQFGSYMNFCSDKLFLLGEIKDPEKIFNSLDLLICPSITESFGLVALESICCGTPVVASNLRAFKEILGEEFLVKSYKVEFFVEKILFLLSKDRQDLRNYVFKKSQKVSSKFSQEEMIFKYNSIYKKVLNFSSS